jgi:hypothetical protein
MRQYGKKRNNNMICDCCSHRNHPGRVLEKEWATKEIIEQLQQEEVSEDFEKVFQENLKDILV